MKKTKSNSERCRAALYSNGSSKTTNLFVLSLILVVFVGSPLMGKEKTKVWTPAEVVPGRDQHPSELIKLAEEFRAIRGSGKGIPDYTAVVKKQKEQLPKLRARLDALDISDWSMHFKIDYLLLRSEMDALEYGLYVQRHTSRDPSFYVNQAIRNVRRHLTGGRRMGDNPKLMPFTKKRAKAVLQALADTEKFLAQGRKNLTEMVPELADIALRHPGGGYYTEGGQLKYIVKNYRKWAEITAKHFPAAEAKKLVPAALEAGKRLLEFGKWLEQNRDKMPGKYYYGKDIVDWYLKHIMLMPYDSDQIKFMSEIERARSISYLQFELHKNRNLPPIKPAKNIKEYLAWDDETSVILRRWYLENGLDLMSDQEYQTLIRSEEGLFLLPFGLIAFPYDEKPGVHRILVVPDDHWRAKYSNMGFRTDPAVLHGHEYWPGHTYAGKLHPHNPCPIRARHRDGGHSEGWCFYHEILPVIMDFPFVRGPRARELPYINKLQRAERMLIGLAVLIGEITPEEAFRLHQENTPPLGSGLGITREEAFEEIEGFLHGGSLAHQCQTGLLQLYKLLADRKMQLKDKFDLKEFNDQFMKYGQIPISLLRWEILGLDDEMKMFWEPVRLSTILHTLPGQTNMEDN